MRFGGVWVSLQDGKVVLQQTSFDDTELDPASQWKQAWQNQDPTGTSRGFVDLDDALACAESMLSRLAAPVATGSTAPAHIPRFVEGRCEIGSLEELRLFRMDVSRATDAGSR